jgi:hypothetical protein
VTGGVPDWLYFTYFAFALGYALTFGAVVLGRRRGWRKEPHDGRGRPDMWPLPWGAATALAMTFLVWRLAFRTLFVAVHQAYPVVAWYIVPMGVVVDLALALGPSIIGSLSLLLPKRVAVFRPYHDLIAAALAGIVAALALYAGIALTRAAGGVVPSTPLAALPFACLTGAIGTALGSFVATRVRSRVQYSSSTSARQTPARMLNSVGSQLWHEKAEGSPLG